MSTTETIFTADVDLAKLTAEQLRIGLTNEGVAVPSKLKKAELVELAERMRMVATPEPAPTVVTEDVAPAKPAKPATAKKAPAKAEPATKLTTEQKRRLGAHLHSAAAALIDTLPEDIADLDAGLVAAQLEAWLKYIPTVS